MARRSRWAFVKKKKKAWKKSVVKRASPKWTPETRPAARGAFLPAQETTGRGEPCVRWTSWSCFLSTWLVESTRVRKKYRHFFQPHRCKGAEEVTGRRPKITWTARIAPRFGRAAKSNWAIKKSVHTSYTRVSATPTRYEPREYEPYIAREDYVFSESRIFSWAKLRPAVEDAIHNYEEKKKLVWFRLAFWLDNGRVLNWLHLHLPVNTSLAFFVLIFLVYTW